MNSLKHTEEMLRGAIVPVQSDASSAHDLWPAVKQRIHSGAAVLAVPETHAIPWYDWALAAGVVALAVASPACVPVLLYYL